MKKSLLGFFTGAVVGSAATVGVINAQGNNHQPKQSLVTAAPHPSDGSQGLESSAKLSFPKLDNPLYEGTIENPLFPDTGTAPQADGPDQSKATDSSHYDDAETYNPLYGDDKRTNPLLDDPTSAP